MTDFQQKTFRSERWHESHKTTSGQCASCLFNGDFSCFAGFIFVNMTSSLSNRDSSKDGGRTSSIVWAYTKYLANRLISSIWIYIKGSLWYEKAFSCMLSKYLAHQSVFSFSHSLFSLPTDPPDRVGGLFCRQILRGSLKTVQQRTSESTTVWNPVGLTKRAHVKRLKTICCWRRVFRSAKSKEQKSMVWIEISFRLLILSLQFCTFSRFHQVIESRVEPGP